MDRNVRPHLRHEALNAERRAEEWAGRVRYLRPAFQAPGAPTQGGRDLPTAHAPATDGEAPRRPWPDTFAGRVAAVRQAAEGGAEALDVLAERGLLAGPRREQGPHATEPRPAPVVERPGRHRPGLLPPVLRRPAASGQSSHTAEARCSLGARR